MSLCALPNEILGEIFSFLFPVNTPLHCHCIVQARSLLNDICKLQQVCTAFRTESIELLFQDLTWRVFMQCFPSSQLLNIVQLCGDQFEREILDPIKKKHLVRRYVTSLMSKIGKLSSLDHLKVLFLGKY